MDTLGEGEDEQELSSYNELLEAEETNLTQYSIKSSSPSRQNTTTTLATTQKRYSKSSQSNQNVKKSKSDCNYNQTPPMFIKSELPNVNTEDEESDYIMAPKYDCENEESFNLKESNRTNVDSNQSLSATGEVLMQDQGRFSFYY